MTNQTTDGVANLPPLPEPAYESSVVRWSNRAFVGASLAADGEAILSGLGSYTAEQMTAYALEALRLASPQGWVLVPMSATPEMCVAGVKRMFEDKQYSAAWEDVYSNVWRAMLAAAPEATKGNGG